MQLLFYLHTDFYYLYLTLMKQSGVPLETQRHHQTIVYFNNQHNGLTEQNRMHCLVRLCGRHVLSMNRKPDLWPLAAMAWLINGRPFPNKIVLSCPTTLSLIHIFWRHHYPTAERPSGKWDPGRCSFRMLPLTPRCSVYSFDYHPQANNTMWYHM